MSNLLQTPTWTATPEKGNQLNSVATSADGRYCITGTSQEYGDGEFSSYCYDSKGNLLWSSAVGQKVKDGVFWVCMSSDGRYAASGGEDFIQAFEVAVGTNIMDPSVSIDGRINEVEICGDGSFIAAVVGSELLLFQRDGNSYKQSDSWSNTDDYKDLYLRSCGISDDGVHIIAGGEYGDDNSGVAFLFFNDNGNLKLIDHWTYDGNKVLRVVISRDGEYWAASTGNGLVSLNQGRNRKWTYTPETAVGSPIRWPSLPGTVTSMWGRARTCPTPRPRTRGWSTCSSTATAIRSHRRSGNSMCSTTRTPACRWTTGLAT